MDIKTLKELCHYSVTGKVPSNSEFANQEVDVNAAFTAGLQELCGDQYSFMKNRYDVYRLITEEVDEIVPKKVYDAVGMFAEVKQVGQGEKAIFKRKLGRTRAKQFLTYVGLSGLYETFRLDHETYEVSAKAIGAACSLDWERFLDGADTMNDLMAIMNEGLVDAIYIEIAKALNAASQSTKFTTSKNYASGNKFDGDAMAKLVAICKSYGAGATIFATPEFVAAMGADAIVSVANNGTHGGVYSPADIDAIHNNGYINIFRGTPVVQIPNAYVDETNTEVQIDPSNAYILPTGTDKIVKVVLEGQTQMRDFQNPDGSMEIHFYKKLGVAIHTLHNWCVFRNTSLAELYPTKNPYGLN